MEIASALVVYKRSFLEKLKSRPRSNLKAIQKAHDENQQCLEHVQRVLRSNRIQHDVRHRSRVKSTRKADLVISVGGDGTFLTAASEVVDTLILGVNSSPKYSVGFFCGASAKTFETVLHQILDDEVKVTPVHRMRVTRDGKVLSDRVLNDVLICQNHPAATSRYVIGVGRQKEDQRSSGIWVATPAGSSAAIRAAGGRVLPVTGRRLQYVVREPYLPPGRIYVNIRGVLKERQKLIVVSYMMKGYLYIDGPRTTETFSFGAKATFDMGGRPLHVAALNRERRKHWK